MHIWKVCSNLYSSIVITAMLLKAVFNSLALLALEGIRLRLGQTDSWLGPTRWEGLWPCVKPPSSRCPEAVSKQASGEDWEVLWGAWQCACLSQTVPGAQELCDTHPALKPIKMSWPVVRTRGRKGHREISLPPWAVPVFRKSPDCRDKGYPLRTMRVVTWGFGQLWVVPRWTQGLSTMGPGREEVERVASPSCPVHQSEGLRSVVLLLELIFISHMKNETLPTSVAQNSNIYYFLWAYIQVSWAVLV